MVERIVEISFKGEANDALAAMFDCRVVLVDRGVTYVHVIAGDRSALHGILAQIDELGLELIGVRDLG